MKPKNLKAKIISEYFEKTDIKLAKSSLLFLDEINSIGKDKRNYYSKMYFPKKKYIDDEANKLILTLEKYEDELIEVSSNYEFQFIKQLAKNIIQVNNVSYTGGVKKRDLYMAKNALWLCKLIDPESKIAIWAHNGHIANDKKYLQNGSMGYTIKNSLGKKYQIVAFGFSYGTFTAVPQDKNKKFKALTGNTIDSDPLKGSLNYILHFAKYKNFIVNYSKIRNESNFSKWLDKESSFLSIGAVYNNTFNFYRSNKIKKFYDSMIYLDKTSASEQLK